jgi:hypothetical protein
MTERGTGRIHHNGVVVVPNVEYEIETSDPPLEAKRHLRGTSYVSGYGDIEGRLIAGTVPQHLHGEPIELELENGRRWACFYANGRLVNSGGIK